MDENTKYLRRPTCPVACFISCFSSPLLVLAIASETMFGFYALYLQFLSPLHCHVSGNNAFVQAH